ncbi:MAG: hypothetical protein CVT63_04500 [Candidatus Anoxymicrobium japonicum]|uniref:Type II secretion system protein GspF domain-containing protein n=1 Tax=Candidatus Anoxymicrobium japonicum TaxID=2013648 RepID=A0A2N3G668_9ACTN|nr:MAG: hypothetical protein CVT63_04500 [Candidatus Anoxymicrobium japonicum]
MRWPGLCILVVAAIYFLWMSRSARAVAAARRNLDRHLEPGDGGTPVLRGRGLLAQARRRIEKTRAASRAREQLNASGLAIRWSVFMPTWLAAALLLPLSSFLMTGSILAAPPALLAALVLPGKALKMLGHARVRKSQEQCDTLAADLTLFLRSGIPVEDALSLCARDAFPPVSDAIARFQSDVALGAGVDTALLDLVGALDNRDLQLIARAMVTSRETGSEISHIMDTIGETVRERSAIRRELESQTVQRRISGRVVAALPLIFLGISALVSRSVISVLLGTTPGLIILMVAVLLDAAGFLWINKILDIK